MLKAALIGLGGMGRGHFQQYRRLMSEEAGVELVALCDIDVEKLKGKSSGMNIDFGESKNDYGMYRLYTDIDDMLEREKELDYVDIVLPTYLHAEATIKALNKGLHVLCEKPMARSSVECEQMIAAAKKNNKKLMIAQCLRFWPEYEVLKEYVEKGTLGRVLAGNFYRGGVTPKWSYQNWLLQKDKSGGVLLDQHVHDVDMINWLFGKPQYVSTLGIVAIKGSGFDIISTQYKYPDNKVISAQDDWMLNGEYGFKMTFRVTFEKGSLVFDDGQLLAHVDGGKSFRPDYSQDMGYYREIKYFINCIANDLPIEICPPESTADSIRIAVAEMRSAEADGQPQKIESFI